MIDRLLSQILAVDNWSHPYHGPDNNPQSNDSVAVSVCGNAVVIAEASKISILGIDNGMNLWSFPPALLSGVWRLTAGIVS